MLKFFVKVFLAFCAISSVFACTSTNSKPLLIGFSADSSSIVIGNINEAGLLQLKNAPASDSVFNNLISVLQTPSEKDTAIMEMPIKGDVSIKGNEVVFIPENPFTKGRDYLVITYLNARFGNAEDIMKGELSYGVKPTQKLLTR
jgi:hypothetical protein